MGYGSHRNSDVFNNIKFCNKPKIGELNTPPEDLFGNDDGDAMPYVFIGDETFPLRHDLWYR